MNEEQRISNILNLLSETKFLKTSDIVELLKIPVSTIQRDLKYLEANFMIVRKYGMVKKAPQSDSYLDNNNKNNKEKDNIAIKAAKLIKDNSIIFIDAGTTTQNIIKYINPNINNLKIVTNSILVINYFKDNPHMEIILVPGKFSKKNMKTSGIYALSFINMFNFDQCFMSAFGVDKNHYYLSNNDEPQLKKDIIKKSKDVYFLVDSSKDNKQGSYIVSEHTNVTRIK